MHQPAHQQPQNQQSNADKKTPSRAPPAKLKQQPASDSFADPNDVDFEHIPGFHPDKAKAAAAKYKVNNRSDNRIWSSLIYAKYFYSLF